MSHIYLLFIFSVNSLLNLRDLYVSLTYLIVNLHIQDKRWASNGKINIYLITIFGVGQNHTRPELLQGRPIT